MHWLKLLLRRLGVVVIRVPSAPRTFLADYRRNLEIVRQESGGKDVIPEMQYDAGEHPTSYKEYECSFAATWISRRKPGVVLDIGSYLEFVLGISSNCDIVSLDVRESSLNAPRLKVVTGDARQLPFDDGFFDAVVSLSSIEHIGLGRYGDEFDLNGDRKAFSEMVRVLRPGGILVFSTTISAVKSSIAFNSHRIYDIDDIHRFCGGVQLEEERYFSRRIGKFCDRSQVTSVRGEWDVYCGCYSKRVNLE